MRAGAHTTQGHVEGLMAWWALAGVDCAVAQTPVNWLKPRPASPPAVSPLAVQGALPDTLDAFHEYLARASDLPEASWPGPRILPTGPQSPRLMILTHAPDAAANTPGAPFEPEGMRLLSRMVKAIGLNLAECYVASLSIVAPAGGMIDAPVLEALSARMRHHIGLVAPKSLLLLGDQANRALSPTDDLAGSGNLPFVNHSAGIVPAAAIAHPRLMLGQPMAKMGAWRILQELVKGWGQ